MRAITRREYGDSDVLRIENVEEPPPERGRVLVEVAAAGVNMAEWHMMSGEPTIGRLVMGLRRPKRAVLGQDVAGVVAAVGPGVTRFAVGDEVFGAARGSWAERASAREDLLQPLPEGVSFEQAAAVPMSGYTAMRALRAVGDVRGKRVAITGAGGGVGSYAVQIAAHRGAHVTAVCSASKATFARELGAHEVIDYAATDPTHGPHRFEAVLDFAGNRPIASWSKVITPRGILILGGGEQNGKILGPLSRSIQAPFAHGFRVITLMASARADDIAELAANLSSGSLRSTHSHTYAFSHAAQAVTALRAATHPGKIVLRP